MNNFETENVKAEAEVTEAMVEELEEVVTPFDVNVVKGTGC